MKVCRHLFRNIIIRRRPRQMGIALLFVGLLSGSGLDGRRGSGL